MHLRLFYAIEIYLLT